MTKKVRVIDTLDEKNKLVDSVQSSSGVSDSGNFVRLDNQGKLSSSFFHGGSSDNIYFGNNPPSMLTVPPLDAGTPYIYIDVSKAAEYGHTVSWSYTPFTQNWFPNSPCCWRVKHLFDEGAVESTDIKHIDKKSEDKYVFDMDTIKSTEKILDDKISLENKINFDFSKTVRDDLYTISEVLKIRISGVNDINRNAINNRGIN